MILQRNKENNIWGQAAPFERVTVSLKKDATTVGSANATADFKGHWNAILPPITAGSYDLIVSASDTLVLHDVDFGDVFLMIGQSNLIMPFGKTDRFMPIPTAQQTKHRWFQVKQRLDSLPSTMVAGHWQQIAINDLDNMPALPYYFDRELSLQTKAPVGLVVSGFGGTPILSWLPPNLFLRKKNGGWVASTVYNAMLYPLVGLSVAGIIWYQGEGDLFAPERYSADLTNFVQSLRALWHDDSLPIFIVQLPSFGQRVQNEASSNWAQIRESQAQVAKRQNATLVVTCDTARSNEPEIHPNRKYELGKRLGTVVATVLYNKQTVTQPEITQKLGAGKIELHFDRPLNGTDVTSGFSIAGQDHNFMPASVKLHPSGHAISLWNDSLPKPEAARYAWADNPYCGLFDQQTRLPISPFRTDKWTLRANNKNIEQYVNAQMMQKKPPN